LHRILAALLVPALLSATSPLSAPHVHAYTDHDHADHRHGSAVHGHHDDDHAGPDAHAPGQSVLLKECNAGRHAIALKFVCVQSAPSPLLSSPIQVQLFARPVEPLVRPAVGYVDVRVHGPPFLDVVAPRPPPISLRQVS